MSREELLAERRRYAAVILAAGPDVCEALLTGLAVPRDRLHAGTLAALGEPTKGPDVVLDDELALRVEVVRPPSPADQPAPGRSDAFRIEDAETFATVDEPGADPLVSAEGGCVVPVGGLVIVYGDGGAGKTTACLDWAVHFAAGASWLGVLEPARALDVLILENEGPRAEFRRKLRRRLASWRRPLEGRLRVLAEPWGSVTLRDEGHREELARKLADVDLVLAGPLSGLGMEGGGTADEVRAFVEFLRDVRERAGHPVAFVIVHHENRGGQVSGAWEPVPDTLVHVQAQGHGRTRVYWQKARWCSALHGTTTQLVWADGDTFTVAQREEITEATMTDEMLAAVRELPGSSWTKIRRRMKGNEMEKAAVRDGLIRDGLLVNQPPREGQFNLWTSDDPAAPRSELRTAIERLPGLTPDGASDTTRSPVPYVSRNGERERVGGTGSEVAERHGSSLGDDLYPKRMLAALASELITDCELGQALAAHEFVRTKGRAA